MKFESYLKSHRRSIWIGHYIKYSELKKLLHDTLDAPHGVYIPTKLSLSSATDINLTAQELFWRTLEKDIVCINDFTQSFATGLRNQLSDLQTQILKADLSVNTERHALLEIAKGVGDEYLQLEKYCNLNYAGLQKILKKHDKLLPHVPCLHFYKAHIASQPWVRGDHQDIQMTLSRTFSELHRSHGVVDACMLHHGHEEYTRNFWVRQQDLDQVRLTLLRHLPVSEEPLDQFEASGMIVNTLCLDSNALELYHNMLYGRPYSTQIQLSWRGLGTPTAVQVQRKVYKEGWKPEAAVKDSFPLQGSKVTDFLLGRLTFAQAHKFMRDQQTSSSLKLLETDSIALEYKLFKAYTEIQRLVENKSLVPTVRIVHKEEVFEGAWLTQGKPGVVVEVQTEIEALLEYSFDNQNNLANGIWLQDQPADRIEFPYALAKVRMPVSSSSEAQLPAWIQPLVDQGLMIEVYDFSKVAFGICGLLPDMVRAVPVWIDDHELQRYLFVNVMQKDSKESLFVESGHEDRADHEDYDTDSGIDESDVFDSESMALLPKDESNHHGRHSRDEGSLRSRDSRKNSLERNLISQPSQGARDLSAHLHSAEGRNKLLEEASIKMRSGMAGWQAKLMQRQGSHGGAYHGQTIMQVEPIQNFRNERVFLNWLSLSVTLAGIAVGMLGFASNAVTDPSELPSVHIAEVTALMLMACAVYICGYALVVFIWRAPRLSEIHASRYDDTSGTSFLNAVVVLALFALFWLNVADFVEVLKGDFDPQDPPAPPPSSPSLLL